MYSIDYFDPIKSVLHFKFLRIKSFIRIALLCFSHLLLQNPADRLVFGWFISPEFQLPGLF